MSSDRGDSTALVVTGEVSFLRVTPRGIAAEIRALFPKFEVTQLEAQSFLLEVQRRGFTSPPSTTVIGPPSGYRTVYIFADNSRLTLEYIGERYRIL